MTMPGRRRVAIAILLAALVVVLWRCTGAFDQADETEAVNVFGPWLGSEAASFNAVLDDFTDQTGIPVHFTGTNDFDSDLRKRVTGGTGLPDIAMIPQPALIAELLNIGYLVPLDDATVEAILANYPFTIDQLTIGDEAYLAPYRTSVKSLVWYRPDVFEENGWTIPETLDELREFSDELARGEIAPWCFSIESGAATGWAATDWVEDLVLRRGGEAVYDDWVLFRRGFDDPAVEDAFTEFESLVLEPGHSFGGVQRVLSEEVAHAGGPLFTDPPGCAMYKQASFATGWFPDGTEIGPDGDVDFFVFPGVEADEAAPLLRGGDGAIQFSDRSEVDQLMAFLVSADGGAAWADRGNYLSTRNSVGVDYYSGVDRQFAELLTEDRLQRFDASDLMPSDLRDTLMAEMTAFIAETSHLDETADLGGLVSALDVRRQELDRLDTDQLLAP